MRRSLSTLTLIALVLSAGAGPSLAAPPQGSVDIGVAPSKLQMRLIPGQTSRSELDIFNKGSQPATLDLYLNDYTISEGSLVEFHEAGSLADSAAPWSALDRKVLRMPPNSHRTVHLTIRVPEDAAIGTHTLAVIFRSREVKTDGSVRYQPAVSTLLAAGVENADGSGLVMDGAAEIREVEVNWISLGDVWNADSRLDAAVDWLIHPTVTARVAVHNEGNTFFNIIEGGAEFDTSFAVGDGRESVTAPSYTILPDSTRTVDATWQTAPWLASGEATVELYYNDTSTLKTAPMRFVVVPWHLILAAGIALVLLLLVWRIPRRGRRRRGDAGPVDSPWLRSGAGV